MILENLTPAEAAAIPDPKTVVTYDNKCTVYTDDNLDTPPTNPAEGE